MRKRQDSWLEAFRALGRELLEVVEGEQVVVLLQVGGTGAPDVASAVADKMDQELALVEGLEEAPGVTFVGDFVRRRIDLDTEEAAVGEAAGELVALALEAPLLVGDQ